MTERDAQAFIYQGEKLQNLPTRITPPKKVNKLLKRQVRRISKHQVTLFAEDAQSLLVVFQAMDCAGKDSTIKNVFTGVNPQGIHVANFKAPTKKELSHGYMWRHWQELPRRGMIGVFNRSHYEEALVMRVHPEYFAGRKLQAPALDDQFWHTRLADLADFEAHLGRNGTHVLKFYLHLSKLEQARRLLARIERPHKNWKFNGGDMVERQFWEQYRFAYDEALAATHTADCPWYVIPADDKPTMRAIVAGIIADKMAAMNMQFPVLEDDDVEDMRAAEKELRAELQAAEN
ncbi:MAG: PPK2 family polyphosphate kinase [Pseudomonadota bacterium]